MICPFDRKRSEFVVNRNKVQSFYRLRHFNAFFTGPGKCGASVYAKRTRYAHVCLFLVHNLGRLPDGNRDENSQNRSVSIQLSVDYTGFFFLLVPPNFWRICFQKEFTRVRRIQEA